MSKALLERLGVSAQHYTQGEHRVHSPIDGSQLGSVALESAAEVEQKISRADRAFQAWRAVPAPLRGELVRLLGEELRAHKADLGELVSWEAGWQPLGVVGIISAFNFPVAVWSWNAALALVCGNPVIWKPSEKTPLTALACQALFEKALARFGDAPADLSQVIVGDRAAGEALVDDPRVALVSATGSTRMGREVGPRVAARFGRCILELGGNNAMILAPSADLDMAVRAILFSAVGTAGQRCTTLRRLIAHRSVKDEIVARLKTAYAKVRIGHPLEGNLIGPLIDAASFQAMQGALEQARGEGGVVYGGERQLAAQYPEAYYVAPAIVEMPEQSEAVRHETFAPILYVLTYDDFDEAVALNNAVPQGLSSCIFTTDVREAEAFMSATGSDCGIANVNIGPSGAEIGGAFGGEKETGGGRESGSDAWKAYMRRQTNTVNYSRELPLAQGIVFD